MESVGVLTDKDCIFCTWEDYMTCLAHEFLCLRPFAHTAYVWAKAAVVLQQEWLQGAHPRSVPRTGIGVTWSFYSFFFFFLHFVIFRFPSSGVQGSLPSSAPCWRAVGRRSLHGRLPATWASRQEEPASCTASTHTHGHSNCSSKLITLQPACLSCFLFY